ncbi:MAG: 30S ribosome-binding factor RbfA [Verrucomicrobiota bacterium]
MSKRISRVNELLHREISEQLRQNYRDAAVAITISEVETSTDLRTARVYYSVLGEDDAIGDARRLFRRIAGDLQRRVSRQVIIKYFPKFEFIYDPSMERGANILNLLDELDQEDDD